jgi:hypothetical protein
MFLTRSTASYTCYTVAVLDKTVSIRPVAMHGFTTSYHPPTRLPLLGTIKGSPFVYKHLQDPLLVLFLFFSLCLLLFLVLVFLFLFIFL